MDDPKVILHVDMDSFYPSVEERENPELRGKPIAVCMFSGRTETSGAVASANYAARKLGIKSGMPIAFAKKKGGGNVVFLKVNKPLYETVSKNIMGILGANADVLEQSSIDEAFLDVTMRAQADFKKAEKLAHRIKAEVKEKERLTCSIGVGPNKLVAKMASGFKKPDGLTVVKPDDARGFLRKFTLGDIWGVGPKTLESLNREGIENLDDLENFSLEELMRIFSDKKGRWLYNAARGFDESPVEPATEREQLGRIATLKEDSKDPEYIGETTDRLAAEVFERFKERPEKFRTVSIFMVTTELTGKTRSKTIPLASRDPEVIKVVARELVQRYLKENKVVLRRVGVGISNFDKDSGQKTLVNF
ncbi:MAG: DNA polymerase IV [Candidatus Altiarchaeota archaeon]|nr:DNA polymerase IV [Candidatus Altiarchaeota archaeon]